MCSPDVISLNFQPAASELSAWLCWRLLLLFFEDIYTPTHSPHCSDRTAISRGEGSPGAVTFFITSPLQSEAPPEEFRCLSALPESTWRAVVPILSVLGSRKSNQQLYLHLSSVFWPVLLSCCCPPSLLVPCEWSSQHRSLWWSQKSIQITLKHIKPTVLLLSLLQ